MKQVYQVVLDQGWYSEREMKEELHWDKSLYSTFLHNPVGSSFVLWSWVLVCLWLAEGKD